MKRSVARPALGAAAVLSLFLTGCGEQAANTGSSPSSSGSSGGINQDLGAKFSGGSPGKKADDSATPLKVGMINQEGGQVSNPEGSAAVQAAFDYINAQQGGIGGHPLKLEVCKVTGTEESAQQCAQKFLNDDQVHVILQGGLNVGADAVHATLNGAKPDIIALPNPGSDTTTTNSFATNPGVIAALPGFANYAVSQGYKSVGLVVSSNPGDLAIAQIAQAIYKSKGVTPTITTFPAGSTDLTTAYTAALAGKPQALTPVVVTTAGCTASAKALKDIGSQTPVIGAGACATKDIKAAFGDFPQWAYESATLSLDAPDDSGQVAFYKAVMSRYAGSGAQLGQNAPASFGAAFVVAKVLNQIGPKNIAPDAISKAMSDYTGAILLGSPVNKFGSVQGMPTLGSVADRMYIYKGDGKWTSTDWQSLPK